MINPAISSPRAIAALILALALILAFAPSAPAQRFTDENGCYTTRNWERRCQATVNLATDALDGALIRAKERTRATYDALEQALIRAETGGTSGSGRVPGAYRLMKKIKAGENEAQ